eukprot:712431-Rhodomonas_salina.2
MSMSITSGAVRAVCSSGCVYEVAPVFVQDVEYREAQSAAGEHDGGGRQGRRGTGGHGHKAHALRIVHWVAVCCGVVYVGAVGVHSDGVRVSVALHVVLLHLVQDCFIVLCDPYRGDVLVRRHFRD